MIKPVLVFLAIFFLLFSCSEEKADEIISLNKNWSFQQKGDSIWYQATVPGCVHTDLFKNQLIDHPYYRDNEYSLQFIDKNDWVYRSSFDMGKNELLNTNIALHFLGLDTYADVYLNDSLVIQADNMHKAWSAEVKPLLREGRNRIQVVFHSTVKFAEKQYDSAGYIVPVSANDQSEVGGLGSKRVSAYVRKAQYHFGWDFAPRFVTSGIYKPVELLFWNDAKVDDIQVIQRSIDDDVATLKVNVKITASRAGRYGIKLKATHEKVLKADVDLEKGVNYKTFYYKVYDPKRWWPNGMGKQTVYSFSVRIYKDDIRLYTKSVDFGFRDIELVRDADEQGESFYFRVNGKPVFAKGANVIPQDMFLANVDKSRIRSMLIDAADANMNMIRVWGGGVYPDEYFYDVCDSLGLMVWQDFMFACSMVPGGQQFLMNVEDEARQQVVKYRNHPCLALWCGNNESVSAWYNWGWRKKEEKEQGIDIANKIEHDYDTLFSHILADVVDECDSGRFYWSSSPQSDIFKPKNLKSGDMHYWMVWWGQHLFKEFWNNAGRFMSEYGFQSIPSISTLDVVLRNEDFNMQSKGFMSHQKSNGGNGRLKFYLDHYYRSDVHFNKQVYFTQLLQARAMETAIMSHRTNKPYCMGSLLWQMNDCWPGLSWSIIDYYGREKAAYLTVKECFEPVVAYATIEGLKRIMVTFVSDLPNNGILNFNIAIRNFEGLLLYEQNGKDSISSAENLQIWMNADDIPSFRSDAVYLDVNIEVDGIENHQILLLRDDKDLKLPHPQFEYALEKTNGGAKMTIQSPVFLRSMNVLFKSYDVDITPAFFNVLPGEKKEIEINTKVDFETLQSSVQFNLINGMFD